MWGCGMTEKRYYIGNGDNCTICDSNKGGSDFFNMLTQFQAVDKLNELSEENDQLKSTNMEMEDYLARLEESNINLRIKLQKIRDYAKEDGEVKQGIIEKVILND